MRRDGERLGMQRRDNDVAWKVKWSVERDLWKALKEGR